jgi:acyl-CoA thioesterase I
MSDFAFFLANGSAFFISMTILLLLVVTSRFFKGILGTLGRDLFVLIAWVFLILSATPIPRGVFALLTLAMFVWVILEHMVSLAKAHRITRPIAGGFCVLVIALEFVAILAPNVPSGKYSRVYIIGDSISAGIGTEGITPWPLVLGQSRGVEIVDLSMPGATTDSALLAVQQCEFQDGLVILEIGGNDMFGGVSPEWFESNLEKLLQRVSGPGRSVVMLELPLMPFHTDLGRVQRRLADRHNVTLIPKRFFANVLGSENGTIDGLHLSNAGHERMSEMLWYLLGGSLVPKMMP